MIKFIILIKYTTIINKQRIMIESPCYSYYFYSFFILFCCLFVTLCAIIYIILFLLS